MRSHNALYLVVVLLGLMALPVAVSEAKPAEQNPMLAKMQVMVRQLSAERDTLKAESAKLAAENAQLQADLAAVKQTAAASAAAEAKLQADLAAAQSHNTLLQGQVDTGQSKVHELTVLGKKLNQSKSQLTAQLADVQQLQAVTATELETCGNKNVELLKNTKEMVGDFNSRGFFSTLLGKESLLGFKQVEVENQIQAYQDKLVSLRYLKQAAAPAAPSANQAENAPAEPGNQAQ